LRRSNATANGSFISPAADDPQSALEKATELLAGDTPITDIALQCGYTDHSAFSRQFKAMTGSTPRDFRLTLADNAGSHFCDCANFVIVLKGKPTSRRFRDTSICQ
jgi:hypothetical protein